MIDLENGTLLDILPVNLVTPETKALSYAFARAQKKMLEFAKALHLYTELSRVPERVLDLMALELGTQYYDQSFPRGIKEKLILQTMVWYMHAGTPSVLDEFLGTVLEGGYIEEWYDYGGNPYFFKAYALTGDREFLPGYASDVKHQIEVYKNVRSWLELLMFITSGEFPVPVQWRAGVTFRNHFSAYSGTEIKLDGKWRLNAGKKLSRFEGDINRYPVCICFTGAGAAEHTDGKMSGMILLHAWYAQPDQSGKLGFRIESPQQPETESVMTIKADAMAAPDAGEPRITIINNLDQTWNLNGTRKLNGGLYIG